MDCIPLQIETSGLWSAVSGRYSEWGLGRAYSIAMKTNYVSVLLQLSSEV